MRLYRIAIGVLFALVSTHVLAQEKIPARNVKAVRFGKLWDAKGKVWTNAIVVIESGKIRAVATDASAIPPGAETIDLSKYTGLPGLIDVHTHMTFYTDETPGVPMLKQMANPVPAVEVFLARKGALRTLEAGVTTVRDLGSDQYMDVAMRDLINRGEMVGPRMFVCGYGLYITATPFRKEGTPPAGGIADGVPEVLRAVRQQIAAGADVIKMYGSTGTDDDVTGFETYTFEEMKAAVDVAHQFGKKIAIHSYGPDGARDAVRAGADSVEHATDMDGATIQEMAKGGTFYVPTRKNRHGLGRDLHHVRREHPRARLVRESRDDAGASPAHRNHERRRAVGQREGIGRRRAWLSCGSGRGGRRSPRRPQCCAEQRKVGDEGRRRGS